MKLYSTPIFVKNSYISDRKKKYQIIPRGIDINYFKSLKKDTDIKIKKKFFYLLEFLVGKVMIFYWNIFPNYRQAIRMNIG